MCWRFIECQGTKFSPMGMVSSVTEARGHVESRSGRSVTGLHESVMRAQNQSVTGGMEMQWGLAKGGKTNWSDAMAFSIHRSCRKALFQCQKHPIVSGKTPQPHPRGRSAAWTNLQCWQNQAFLAGTAANQTLPGGSKKEAPGWKGSKAHVTYPSRVCEYHRKT